MKIWDVFKALSENPEKEFLLKSECGEVRTLGVEEGYVTFRVVNARGVDLTLNYPTGRGAFSENIKIDAEWEEVRKPVSWQEALQAWANGKDIELKRVGGSRKLINGYGLFLHEEDLVKGTWYILDEGETKNE